MHSTLIFPGIGNREWNCFENSNSCEARFVPHGLASIASYARTEGHSIDAIDMRRLHGWEEFDNQIDARSPGVFAISSMSVDYGIAQEAIKRIKRIHSGSAVIMGGVHATVALDDIAGNHDIDFIITGEGEISFSRLLRDLDGNRSVARIIHGIKPDIDTLPFADRDLFGFVQGEMKTPWLPHMYPPFISIIASRGCPHRCAFCQPAERAVFGGRARIRSVENVIEELRYLRERYQFRSLLIHDDYFAFNPAWVDRFCDSYRQNGFDQSFTCQVRSDFVVKNEDLVIKMADSGLSCFMIGFESGSQRVLDFVKKDISVEMNRRAVEICHRLGIRIFANYMMGIPTETPREVFDTVEFIRWARPEYPSPAFFTPHPGSELYDYCKAHDLSLIQSYKSYARNPTEPKIKGVDYEFLNFAVQRSMEFKIDKELIRLRSITVPDEEIKKKESALLQRKDNLNKQHEYYGSKFLNNKINIKNSNVNKKVAGHGRVLVTGGTGFIGSALVLRLHEMGLPVTVLTRNRNNRNAMYFASRGVDITEGSVENEASIAGLTGFETIFHLAVFQGLSGPELARVNIEGTRNVLDMAIRNKVRKFIFASSIEAQGPSTDPSSPLNEEDPCHTVSEYGSSKLEGEKIIQQYMQKEGLNAIMARIGNVYGKHGLSFIHAMSTAIIEKNILLAALPLFAERLVQPIYVEDLAAALVHAGVEGNGMSGVFNFTGHLPVTVHQWFMDLAALLGLEEHISDAMTGQVDRRDIPALRKSHPHINYFLSGDEPSVHRVYSDTKLLQTIGEYQTYNLQKGLAYTIDHYRRAGVFNAYLTAQGASA